MSASERVGDHSLWEKVRLAESPSASREALTRINELVSRVGRPFGVKLSLDVTYEGSYLYGFESEDTRYAPDTGESHATALRTFLPAHARVLDIGCGYGRIERFLAPHCSEIHGVDVSGIAVRKAAQYVQAPNCHFHQIEGKDLSLFPPGRFNFVFSVGTLQHVSKETGFNLLAEAHRVLRPGGKLLIHLPDLRKAMRQFALHALSGVEGSTRMRFYTEEETKAILDFIGFRGVELLPDGFLHPNSIHVLGTR